MTFLQWEAFFKQVYSQQYCSLLQSHLTIFAESMLTWECFSLKIKVIFCSLKKCFSLQSHLYYICWEHALEKYFSAEKIKSCLQSLLCWEHTYLKNASAEIKVISQSLLLRHASHWDQNHLLLTALKVRLWRFSFQQRVFLKWVCSLKALTDQTEYSLSEAFSVR